MITFLHDFPSQIDCVKNATHEKEYLFIGPACVTPILRRVKIPLIFKPTYPSLQNTFDTLSLKQGLVLEYCYTEV